MTQTIQSYITKVSALCARPDLSDPKDREDFFRRLIAYWTRQLNMHTKGQPIPFTPLEVDDIIDFLQHEIERLRDGNH